MIDRRFSVLLLLPAMLLTACVSTDQYALVIDETLKSELGIADERPIFAQVELEARRFEDETPRFMARDYYALITDKLRTSGLFLDEPIAGQPNATIKMYWDFENHSKFVVNVMQAATLLLLPKKERFTHNLRAEVWVDNQLHRTWDYVEEFEYVESVYTDNSITGANWFHLGINPILLRFVKDLKEDGVLDIVVEG